MNPIKSLGDRIRAARQIVGLSMEDLARTLDVTKTSISEWELNKKMPRIEHMPELRKLLRVSLDHLICGDAGPVVPRILWQANETPAVYDAGKLTPRDMRSIRMSTVFERLNEAQQKSLIEVAGNMVPPARATGKPTDIKRKAEQT